MSVLDMPSSVQSHYCLSSKMNLYPTKVLAGIMAGFVAVFFESLLPLFVAVAIFEMVDFITGVIKSGVIARRKKEKFAFESVKAWRTIYKIILIFVGIVLAEMLDATFAEERLRFANYFTGFCCGVEFWSFLENAAVISNHPLFRWLRKFMKIKVEEQVGIDFDEITSKKKDNGEV